MKVSGSVPLVAAFVLTALTCACGGASPPPQTAAQGPSTSGSAAADSASLSPSPAQPTGSPDLSAGTRAFDAGNYAEARKAFEAVTKKNPNDAQAFYDLGMSCEKLGDKPAAEAAYKVAISVRPEFDTAAAALSSLMIDAGRVDEALAVARAGLAKHPGSAALHENLGQALAMRGDRDNATAEFEQAIQSAPSEPLYHLNFAHWLNAWHVRGATPHLDVALGLAKEDLGLLAAIGLEYRYAGEFDACIKTFDRAAQIKDGGEIRTQRALCKVGKKNDKGALDDLQAAVAKEPSYAPAHYYLGGRLALLKRFKEAAAEYAKYLELDPNGSLSKQASERLKAAQDEAGHDKGGPGSKKKP